MMQRKGNRMAHDKQRSGGSGTAGRGIENEGTGSLRVPDQKDRKGNVDASTESEANEERKADEDGSGPIRSGQKRPPTDQDRAEGGAREGYEDHGGSRDDDGTHGESSGSRPKYQ